MSLLNKALKVAAIEAYQNEVLEQSLYDTLIGTNKPYPTSDSWMRERIDSWLAEAELFEADKNM